MGVVAAGVRGEAEREAAAAVVVVVVVQSPCQSCTELAEGELGSAEEEEEEEEGRTSIPPGTTTPYQLLHQTRPLAGRA